MIVGYVMYTVQASAEGGSVAVGIVLGHRLTGSQESGQDSGVPHESYCTSALTRVSS